MEDYDFEYVDPDAQEAEELRLPRVTWLNGKTAMKAAGGIAYTGGMTAKRESLKEGAEIPNWTVGSFEAGGKVIETLENTNPVITVVRYRRRWAKFDDNVCQDWYPITGQHQDGYKIQIEAAGFIKGFDLPVRFDLRGHASTALLDAMRDHAGKVVAVANRKAPQGKALPAYAFWLRLKAGAHEKVGKGKQSDATKPQLVAPKEITDDYVRQLYVGREMLLRSQELFRELDDWAREWNGQAVPNQAHGAEAGESYRVPEYAGPPRDELEGALQHAKRKAAAAGGDPCADAPVLDNRPSDEEDDSIPF